MKCIPVLIAFTFSVVYGWNDGIIKFSVDDVEKSVVERIIFYKHLKNAHHSRLGTYIYKNCLDPSKEILVLSNLTLRPDPLSFPGILAVSFKGVIKTTVDAPLSADVLLERRIGSSWIKIPCIGLIGSCHYDDLCELLAGATCPKPFVDNNIPCKCPFGKGDYTLPTSQFKVLAAVFPPGDYHAQANLTYNKMHVACVDLHVSFS